jgi:hypothetical protein
VHGTSTETLRPTQEQPTVRAFCAAENAAADEVCRAIGYVAMSEFTIAKDGMDDVKKACASTRIWLTTLMFL